MIKLFPEMTSLMVFILSNFIDTDLFLIFLNSSTSEEIVEEGDLKVFIKYNSY